mgnify:CR=1 FL=1|tara:strand:+ start:568 stop:2040 length:1473 start_codon:yes stop_codon:yes gene_type:complete
MIKFGEFLPDRSAFGSVGTTVAVNVVPSITGYESLDDIAPVSGAADGIIKGMYAATDDDNNFALYAGDSTKLYKLDTTDSSLTNISKAGNYTTAAADRWRFVQFGESVIATNFGDPIQTITAAASGLFSDLSADAPKAKYIAVVRDFVFTGYNYDATDGTKPYRVRWSGINDHTSWAIDPVTQADFQDISDLGEVTGLVGGEYATILMQKGIVRAEYIGSPLIFQFDKVETNRGCKVPNSVCNVGSNVFYLADDGFYVFDGAQSTPIGAEKVDRFFLGDFNSGYAENMSASVDPIRKIVVWSYPSTESADGSADKLIIYNYFLGRWSTAEVAVDTLAPLYSSGYTLENLDNLSGSIDDLPASLDSAFYRGGEFFFAASKDKKIQSFTGATLPATLETGEFEIQSGFSSNIRNIIPYITVQQSQSAVVTAQVASRNRQIDTFEFGAAGTLNSDNYIPVRSTGKYHRIRVNLTGGWRKAQGVEIEASKLGRR